MAAGWGEPRAQTSPFLRSYPYSSKWNGGSAALTTVFLTELLPWDHYRDRRLLRNGGPAPTPTYAGARRQTPRKFGLEVLGTHGISEDHLPGSLLQINVGCKSHLKGWCRHHQCASLEAAASHCLTPRWCHLAAQRHSDTLLYFVSVWCSPGAYFWRWTSPNWQTVLHKLCFVIFQASRQEQRWRKQW